MEKSSLQVSIFKDLVTLADPSNPFSFISYLHQHGRLYQFLNAQFENISRQEFRAYLKWVAESNENIVFGEPVQQVSFDGKLFIVETSKRRVASENVVVGVGVEPNIPDFAFNHLDGVSNFHIQEFSEKSSVAAGKRVVVIGGGQSGAEAVLDLIRRSNENAPAAVTWISRRENFFSA